MAIHGTQVPMYIKHTLFLYFFFNFFYIKHKINKTEKQTNKNMLNKAKYKTRCKCLKKKGKKSSHGNNTNILTKEFEAFTVKRFGKQVSLLIIGVNKRKSESTIFDKLPNEVMSNLYVFGSRMLNRILKDVNGTGIVTIDSEMLLTNTIIMEEFLHP